MQTHPPPPTTTTASTTTTSTTTAASASSTLVALQVQGEKIRLYTYRDQAANQSAARCIIQQQQQQHQHHQPHNHNQKSLPNNSNAPTNTTTTNNNNNNAKSLRDCLKLKSSMINERCVFSSKLKLIRDTEQVRDFHTLCERIASTTRDNNNSGLDDEPLRAKDLKAFVRCIDVDDIYETFYATAAAAAVPVAHHHPPTSNADVDRKLLRDTLYSEIFQRHRRSIFAFGSFLRMLKTRKSNYNVIKQDGDID